MSDLRVIENRTSRLIVLPPTFSFQKGVRLVPGLNRVSVVYLDELTTYEVPAGLVLVGGRTVKVPARRPGAEALEELQRPLSRPDSVRRYRGLNGFYGGPQITVHADAGTFEDRDEGPVAPDFLPADERLALAIIGATNDKVALSRWAAIERGAAAGAARARLNNLTKE